MLLVCDTDHRHRTPPPPSTHLWRLTSQAVTFLLQILTLLINTVVTTCYRIRSIHSYQPHFCQTTDSCRCVKQVLHTLNNDATTILDSFRLNMRYPYVVTSCGGTQLSLMTLKKVKLTYDVVVTATMYQTDAFLREINYQSTKKRKWIYYINLYKFNEYLYSKFFTSKLG